MSATCRKSAVLLGVLLFSHTVHADQTIELGSDPAENALIDSEEEESPDAPPEPEPVGEDAAGSAAMESGGSEEATDYSRYWTLGYAAVFYGPALESPGVYQPRPNGGPDLNRPVQLRNYAHLSYALTDKLALTGTFYWLWQAPVSQHLSLQDPQLRVSYDRIIDTDQWSLYADVRFHVPVSSGSQLSNLYGGVQLFQALGYSIPYTALRANLYLSQRFNFYGSHGVGNDVELYFAPNLTFQAFRTVAFSLTVESGASHVFGDRFGLLGNDGMDIEPGVVWDISPQLSFNPYLSFYPTAISARNTMLGASLNWMIF